MPSWARRSRFCCNESAEKAALELEQLGRIQLGNLL